MRILVAEDDPVSRKIIVKFLEPYGSCDVAVDGMDAVSAFKTACEEKQPYNLVCLDIMMPKMNGQDVLKEIRRIEEDMGIRGLNAAKVIMTTARDDSTNIMEAFKSKSDGYLTKPINRKMLQEKITEAFKQKAL